MTTEQKTIRRTKKALDAHKVIIITIGNDGHVRLIGDTERPLTRVLLQTGLNEIDEKYKCEREVEK